LNSSLRLIPVKEILELQKKEIETRKEKDAMRNQMLHDRGFSVDVVEHDLY